MNEISRHMTDEDPNVIANRLINKAEYRDGLREIVIGVLILMFASLTGSEVIFKPGSFGSKATFWGMMLLLSMLGFGSQWAIKKVRKRFLIGKMGYVKLKPVNRKRLGIRLGIILGLSFVIAALAAFAMFKVVIAPHRGGGGVIWGFFPPAGWAFVGTGIIGGAVMVFRVRLLRYAIGGVIMAVMGILLAFNRVSLPVGLTTLYGFAGLLALLSGCVVFLLFLRQPTGTGE
ncbi:MAG TPA: hypothetical protein VKG86_01555 [Terracidiphilus sp.]|nr:hypothetical protein [Terracidiphilus sp.]